jgi:hypothetical protein
MKIKRVAFWDNLREWRFEPIYFSNHHPYIINNSRGEAFGRQNSEETFDFIPKCFTLSRQIIRSHFYTVSDANNLGRINDRP